MTCVNHDLDTMEACVRLDRYSVNILDDLVAERKNQRLREKRNQGENHSLTRVENSMHVN